MNHAQQLITQAVDLIRQGCLPEAQEVLEKAEVVARNEKDEVTARDAASTLAGVFKRKGDFEMALTKIREVYASAVRDDDVESQQLTLSNEAVLLWEMSNGDHQVLKTAWERAEMSRVLCVKHNLDDRLVFVLGTCGLIARFLGRIDDAQECFKRQVELARKIDNPDDLGRALLNLMVFSMETDDPNHATKLALELYDMIDRIRDPDTRNNAANFLRQLGIYEQ